MIIEVCRNMFIQEFRDIRPDNFSLNGLDALFDYITEYEEDLGEQMKLDVIALCCEFREYDTLADYNSDYDSECESWDDVADETTVIPITDEAAIIQQH
jgi:hypothetical protein